MNCSCSNLSPFRWQHDRQPSQFSSDPKFCTGAKSGRTMSQITSEMADKHVAKTGRSLGTVYGISKAADARSEASELARRRKAKG